MRSFLLVLCLLSTALWPFSAQAATKPAVKPVVVTVQKGQTLFALARKHHVSVKHLQVLNGLSGTQIRAGQVIKLTGGAPARTVLKGKVGAHQTQSKPKIKPSTHPKSAATASQKAAKAHRKPKSQTKAKPKLQQKKPRAAPRLQGIYTVKAGDSLGHIARAHGVGIKAVQHASGLSSTALHAGQKLRIPLRKSPSARISVRTVPALPRGMEARKVYTFVTVRPGQTVSSFAAKYSTTAAIVRRLNHLNTVRDIVPGKRLLVPRTMALPVSPRPKRRAVSFQQLKVRGVNVQVVRVDLRHRDVLVAPVLPRADDFARGATVGALTRISGAQALINGSYFHPRSYVPAGDIVRGGRLLTWGRLPVALAITPDNRARIVGGASMGAGRASDSSWDGMETVISSGPLLVRRGTVQTSYSRVFQDPAVFGQAARSAVGLLGSRDLLLVSTHQKLGVGEMARVMLALGARDALLLDGGSSTGLSYNGHTVLNSVRKVSYGIGVFTNYKGLRYSR